MFVGVAILQIRFSCLGWIIQWADHLCPHVSPLSSLYTIGASAADEMLTAQVLPPHNMLRASGRSSASILSEQAQLRPNELLCSFHSRFHDSFARSCSSISLNLTWTLACINIWYDRRYFLNSSANLQISTINIWTGNTTLFVPQWLPHSKVSGFSIRFMQRGFSLLTWHTVDLRRMKCPWALTKACTVRKIGQEIFVIEHSLWDLTQRRRGWKGMKREQKQSCELTGELRSTGGDSLSYWGYKVWT